MNIITATCIIIALTLPASAKTIKNDRGGVIEHRLAEIAELRSSGEPVTLTPHAGPRAPTNRSKTNDHSHS